MATDKKDRPVRVLNDDTTDQELRAGHRIPGADPPTGNEARGGFGNRDGKQGYGSDSEDGSTAVTVNEIADRDGHPADNMRTTDEGRPVKGESEDVALTLDELAPYDGPAGGGDIGGDIGDTAAYRRAHPTASDTGPSGEAGGDLGLTEDGNNVRPDAAISGQEGLTFGELARHGTNADLIDPNAQSTGIAHAIEEE